MTTTLGGRYMPVSQYMKLTKMSYPTIMKNLKSGMLQGIETEKGLWRVWVPDDSGANNGPLLERLERQEQMLEKLMAHLGVKA